MTTYWVKGHDPVYLEKQKQFSEDANKNSLISVKEMSSPFNNSMVNVSKATTPNGSVVLTNNMKQSQLGMNNVTELSKDTRSVPTDHQNDKVTKTNTTNNSIKPEDDKSAIKPNAEDFVNDKAVRTTSIGDLIQFDGRTPDNEALFPPVELSVSGDTPVDDIIDELLNTSNTSLRYQPHSCS